MNTIISKSLWEHTQVLWDLCSNTPYCAQKFFLKSVKFLSTLPIHQSNLYWKSDDYVLEKARIEDYLIQYYMGVKQSHTTKQPCLQQHKRLESAGNVQLLTTW